MLRRYGLLLLLCLLPLAGCARGGTPEAETTAETEPLSAGWYALSGADGADAGYLRVTGRGLIFFDADGKEQDRLRYTFDAAESLYRIDGRDTIFSLEDDGETRRLSGEDATYTLAPVAREDIPAAETPEAAAETVTDTEHAALPAEEVYRLALPSTVEITGWSDLYLFTGSGFFDDEHGTVITNYHVIDGIYGGVITTADGEEYEILSVLGYDAGLDLAVLATDCPESVPLEKRDTTLERGDAVYALGAPGGVSWTLTEGTVSTPVRENGGHTYIQHTASISQGSSGGPLLDGQGRVAGINCAYIAGAEKQSLAIPIVRLDALPRAAGVTLLELYEEHYGPAEGAA